MTAPPLRVYLVDDEPPAVERLERMLAGVPEIQVAGSTSDPAAALDFLSREAVDAVFLDIEMPGINGFELLARLPEQPLVIFTTAYDQYALKAFAVNSIDFLLDPVDQEQLARALRKLERLRSAGKPKWMRQPEMQALLHELAASLRPSPLDYPERIASRVGERTHLVELSAVTHFFARDKLTYAAILLNLRLGGGSAFAIGRTDNRRAEGRKAHATGGCPRSHERTETTPATPVTPRWPAPGPR
jgi:two-component system LytT family response regulator